jgi:Family of unknown function (DUF5427)
VKNSPSLKEIPDKSSKNPTTTTYLFMRLQPFINKTILAASADRADPNHISNEYVQFYILLFEPTNALTHYTVSQAIPHSWIESWDTNEWVEDLIVDSLRLATQVVGQEYIISRMGTSSKTTKVNSNNRILDGSLSTKT